MAVRLGPAGTCSWQRLWLMPPTLGRMIAIVGQLSGGSYTEKTLVELPLHGAWDWLKRG